ncbi:MAG: hypothetical protein ACI8Q1_003792 [Parvicella sp.]|jgi:hypothetical protein
MSFHNPDAEWLATRFTLLLSFGLNYILVRMALSKLSAKVFLIVTLFFLCINIAGALLNMSGLRLISDDMMLSLSQPTLILILLPVRLVYKYLSKDSSLGKINQ